MYKRTGLFLLITVASFDAVKPMDLALKSSTFGCQPLEIMHTLWHEYKPIIYTSVFFVVSGLFVFDFLNKRQRIKQLEHDVAELKNNKVGQAFLGETTSLRQRLEDYSKNLHDVNEDLNCLWKIIFTTRSIVHYNRIENQDQPFKHRPHIPQYEGWTLRDFVKAALSEAPLEITDPYQQVNSPRRRSNSPPKGSSPRSNNGNGKPKAVSATLPARKNSDDNEKEKEKEHNTNPVPKLHLPPKNDLPVNKKGDE